MMSVQKLTGGNSGALPEPNFLKVNNGTQLVVMNKKPLCQSEREE
jgi:hypothetical protein